VCLIHVCIDWSIQLHRLVFTRKPVATLYLPKRPRKTVDSAIFLLLVFYALSATYTLIRDAPPDLLDTLKVKTSSPSYVLRNSFREFMSDAYDGWTDGGVPDPNWDEATITEIQNWEALYVSLKGSKETRRLYQSVGHVAFLECDWCKDRTDYLLHLASGITASYFLFLVVVGLATSTWRKEAFRMYAVCGILCALSVDAYLIGVGETKETKEIFGSIGEEFPPFILAFYVRYSAFIMICVGLMTAERKEQYTNAEIAVMGLEKLGRSNNGLASARIVRGVGMKSSNLRRKCFEYWREKAEGAEKSTEVCSLNIVTFR
jgi:hypothetical protein